VAARSERGGDDLHPDVSAKLGCSSLALQKSIAEVQLTILPSLASAAAFLAFENRLASLLAVALQRLFARFVGRCIGGRFFAIEGD
jgi:hypothetical protein